ncbi:MAG: substrate-binding domain-containing protein [Pirellulaceae bacterium]|nr:substrate-binding domain-containing protein [Pirellulaceae bacterium]
MKRTRTVVPVECRPCGRVLCSLAVLWGFVWLAALGGCSGPANQPGQPSATQTRRLILLTNGDDPFWDAMRQGMNKASEDLRLSESGLAVFLDKGDFSEEAQINKLQQYATQSDIAAVAISPVDAKNRGIADAMRALRAKGVHVIAVDSDMDRELYRDCRFAYLGTDNIVGGQELGKAAKGLRPDGGVYATFVGLKAVANAIERIGGFGEGAGPKFREADSLGDQGDENLAQENVKTALTNHPDINTLVGIWAYNAHAIVQVVKERNLRDKITVVVFDAAPLALSDMEEGQIDAMVVQNPYQMGYLGTKLMKALVEEDQATVAEMYPDYDPETTNFKTPDGDIYTTELRVVVPDASSPLKPEMFSADTKFFYFQDFKHWLAERSLTGS